MKRDTYNPIERQIQWVLERVRPQTLLRATLHELQYTHVEMISFGFNGTVMVWLPRKRAEIAVYKYNVRAMKESR